MKRLTLGLEQDPGVLPPFHHLKASVRAGAS
jgi:hypothetical protein